MLDTKYLKVRTWQLQRDWDPSHSPVSARGHGAMSADIRLVTSVTWGSSYNASTFCGIMLPEDGYTEMPGATERHQRCFPSRMLNVESVQIYDMQHYRRPQLIRILPHKHAINSTNVHTSINRDRSKRRRRPRSQWLCLDPGWICRIIILWHLNQVTYLHRCIINSCHPTIDSLYHLVTRTMMQSTGLETWDWSAAEFYAEMSESLSKLFGKTWWWCTPHCSGYLRVWTVINLKWGGNCCQLWWKFFHVCNY